MEMQGVCMALYNTKASDAPTGASPLKQNKFFYVYVLRSLIVNWIYVGYSEDIKKRLGEHNSGKSPSTCRYKPLELIHILLYHSSMMYYVF